MKRPDNPNAQRDAAIIAMLAAGCMQIHVRLQLGYTKSVVSGVAARARAEGLLPPLAVIGKTAPVMLGSHVALPAKRLPGLDSILIWLAARSDHSAPLPGNMAIGRPLGLSSDMVSDRLEWLAKFGLIQRSGTGRGASATRIVTVTAEGLAAAAAWARGRLTEPRAPEPEPEAPIVRSPEERARKLTPVPPEVVRAVRTAPMIRDKPTCCWPLWDRERPGQDGYGRMCRQAVARVGAVYCAEHMVASISPERARR